MSAEDRAAKRKDTRRKSGIESLQQKRTKEALKWESRVNAALAELSNFLIGSDKPIAEIADQILERAKELTGSKHGYVTYVEPETGDAISYTLSQMLDLCRVQPEEKRGIVFPKGKNGRYPALWGHSLNTGVAFYTNSPRSHEASVGLPKGHIPVGCFLSAPAMIGEKKFGQIALANPAEPYTDSDLEAVKRIAVLYALALQRHRTQEELAKHRNELERLVEARTAELTVANRLLESEISVRRKAEESLQERLRFERVFSELSARFVNLPAGELDAEIDRGLRVLVEFLGVERSTLYQFSEDMSELRITHSQSAPGVRPMPLGVVNKMFPWFTQKLRDGGLVLYSGRQDLPEEAVQEREFIARERIRSYVSIPLAAGQQVLGAATFVNFQRESRWSEELIQRLRLLAETVTGAILRMRGQESLLKKEEGLAEAQRIAHVGNWDWNIVTNGLTWSDEVFRIFGLQPQEFGATYDAFLESVHPEDRQSLKDAVNRSLADPNAHYSIEHRVIRRDGALRVVHEQGEVTFDETGKPVRMIGTVHDITERKEAEEAMRQSREFLQRVIDGIPDPTMVIGRDHRVLLANRAAQTIAGGDPVEKGLRCFEVLHCRDAPCDGPSHSCPLETVFHTKKPALAMHKHYNEQGQEIVVETNAAPILDVAGNVIQIVESCRDVTERVRTEQEMTRLREELAHVARVTTMGELAASLAHELNQPLTAIASNARAALRFMDRTDPDLDEVREALEDVVNDGRRAGEVIRRLRALLKKGELERMPLNINEVAEEILSLLHSEAVVKGVALRMELGGGLPPVSGDRIQIQQVLMNLMMNGMEAMAGVRAEAWELVVKTTPHDGDAVRVSVQDAGTGLDEENMAKLFTPFFTTKSEGMGMGLAIARSIVEAHGGRLWATNNPDRGATFHFTLPVSLEERA